MTTCFLSLDPVSADVFSQIWKFIPNLPFTAELQQSSNQNFLLPTCSWQHFVQLPGFADQALAQNPAASCQDQQLEAGKDGVHEVLQPLFCPLRLQQIKENQRIVHERPSSHIHTVFIYILLPVKISKVQVTLITDHSIILSSLPLPQSCHLSSSPNTASAQPLKDLFNVLLKERRDMLSLAIVLEKRSQAGVGSSLSRGSQHHRWGL